MINITTQSPDSIQNYLNQAKSFGGGVCVLQPGTYTLTSDISIPDGVTLEGASRDNCIIDCNSDYGIYMEGVDTYSTGTLTINYNATEIVGSGTTWTSDMVGQFVLLDGDWYEITAFTDTTHLTIETYKGVNLSGSTYVIATTNFNPAIKTVTVTNATGAGITTRYSMEANILDVAINDCGTGVDIDYSVFPKINVTATGNGVNCDFNYVEGFSIDFSEFSYSTSGAGLVMTNTNNSTYFNSSANKNTGNGISMTSCSKIAFVSFDISRNGGKGLEMISGCNDNEIGQGTLELNSSDGIKLTATSDRNIISSLTTKTNGAYGVNIAAASCDNNILIGVVAASNVTASLNDSGTGTLKSTTVNILP